jgi:hypothetical protein
MRARDGIKRRAAKEGVFFQAAEVVADDGSNTESERKGPSMMSVRYRVLLVHVQLGQDVAKACLYQSG